MLGLGLLIVHVYSPVLFASASFVPFAAIFWNLSGGACLWESLCKAFYIRAVVKIASREGESESQSSSPHTTA